MQWRANIGIELERRWDEALRANEAVNKAYLARRQECKGATSGNVCQSATSYVTCATTARSRALWLTSQSAAMRASASSSE